MYSNYKISLIKKSGTFLFGDIYEKINFKNLKLKKSFDGRYCFVHVKNYSSQILPDQFSRLDIFYTQKKNDFLVSSNFRIITKILQKKTINQVAIGHSLNVIGIRPPKKDTFFNEISRIGVNETLSIIKNKIVLNTKMFNSMFTENYNDSKIDEYFKLNQRYLSQLSSERKKYLYVLWL